MSWIKEGIELWDRLTAAWKRLLDKEWVSRPFLVEPMRTADPDYREHVVTMIRAGAGVPLVRCKGPNRLADILRAARAVATLQDATPKPAFRAAGWKHTSTDQLDSDVVHTTTGSSILLVHLADQENAEHMTRSAQLGIFGDRRLVVIAVPEDLCDPNASVRCFYTNALAVERVEGEGSGVILPSSTSIADEQAVTVVKAQGSIPPSALWLICDSDNQTRPTEDWGRRGEEFMATRRQLAENSEMAEELRRQAKRLGTARIALFAFGGLGPVAAFFPWSIVDGLDSVDKAMLGISMAWLAVAVAVGVHMARAAAMSRRLSWRWRRQARNLGAQWTGGTLRGLFLRRMLKGVFLKKGKKAADLWASAWPSSSLLQARALDRKSRQPQLRATNSGVGGSEGDADIGDI